MRGPRFRAILAAACVLSAACGHDKGGDAAAPQAAAFLVDVAPVGTRDIEVAIESVGTAYASGQVDVRPQVAGTLVAAPFVEGDLVEAGQVLAVLDDSKPRASLALVEAQLDSARAKRAVATERLGRFRRLASEDLVSREEYATLESEQKAADAAVREHEAEVRLAQRNLEDFTLRAPISGRMGIRHVDLGNFLEKGTVIATLVAADPLEVLFTVPGAQAGGIAVGQEAEIRATDPSHAILAVGKVRVLDARVDTDTRMLGVKAVVANAEGRMRAGQFVSVRLVRERRPHAAVIPEDAVIPAPGRATVFVARDGVASRRDVVLGERIPGLVEVREGLSPGETVVVRGQHRLADGARVEARASAAPATPAPAAAPAPSASAPASR